MVTRKPLYTKEDFATVHKVQLLNSKQFLGISLVLICVGGLLNLAAPQVAALSTFQLTSAPACVSRTGTGTIDCFARGNDNAIWQTTYGKPIICLLKCWSIWKSLGGGFLSAPSVTSMSASDLEVVGQGLNTAMYSNSWNGATWSGWSEMPTTFANSTSLFLWANSAASCNTWSISGPLRISCFARGTDNNIYGIEAGPGLPLTWTNWFSLGAAGVLSTGPASSSWGPNNIELFARGNGNSLYTKHWAGLVGWSSWSDPFPTPAFTLADDNPGCVSWGLNRVDCFVTGTSTPCQLLVSIACQLYGLSQADSVYHISSNGATWSSWEYRGGPSPVVSGPTVSSMGVNELDVFVTGYDGGMWQETWNGATWSNWVPVNPAAGLGEAIDFTFNSPLGSNVVGTLGFDETANIDDDAGAGFMIAHSTHFASDHVFTFTDATRVNQATGEPTFIDYQNAVVVGGRNANPTTAFYENNGLAHLKFRNNGDGTADILHEPGDVVELHLVISSLLNTDNVNDYFTMQSFQDNGHTVIELWGLTQYGTLASGVYFNSQFINLRLLTAGSYIVHWTGTTPGVPLPTDTYKVVYSD